MSKAVITSYTLLDFLSEGDMLAFFTFVEEHMDCLLYTSDAADE